MVVVPRARRPEPHRHPEGRGICAGPQPCSRDDWHAAVPGSLGCARDDRKRRDGQEGWEDKGSRNAHATRRGAPWVALSPYYTNAMSEKKCATFSVGVCARGCKVMPTGVASSLEVPLWASSWEHSWRPMRAHFKTPGDRRVGSRGSGQATTPTRMFASPSRHEGDAPLNRCAIAYGVCRYRF
jgi:hypothetical protein